MDSVSSTTFIKKPPFVTDVQKNILFTREILIGRLFMGFYQERRYVPVLNEYRDVIIISNEETELHNDLDKIRNKWLSEAHVKWVGITGPDVSRIPKKYCFWVKLLDKPFGYYWFQIKHVKLLEEELILHLKCVRNIHSPESSVISHDKFLNEKKNEKSDTEASTSLLTTNTNMWERFLSIWETSKNNIKIITPYLTWRYLFSAVKMACAFIIIFLIGMISTVHHLGEYLLRLIQELVRLVNAFTPIFVHLLDFLSKIVGGFYILLAGIFIGNRRRTPPQGSRNIYHSVSYSSIRRVSLPGSPVDWKERNRILRQELLSDSRS